MPDITKADYRELMENMWNPLVEKGLSFVIKSAQTGKTIGVTLNFDLWDEPEVILTSKLMIVFDFLEYLEAPIRENKLPKGKGQVIHNSMMATSSHLNSAENVLVMRQMEEYCLRIAERKEFAGIFTTNTSPLTQVNDKINSMTNCLIILKAYTIFTILMIGSFAHFYRIRFS